MNFGLLLRPAQKERLSEITLELRSSLVTPVILIGLGICDLARATAAEAEKIPQTMTAATTANDQRLSIGALAT